MSGPNGVITISGNHKRSMECALAGSNLAQSLVIAEEKRRIKEVVERAQQAVLMGMPNMANLNGSVTFQAPKETKQVPMQAQQYCFYKLHFFLGYSTDVCLSRQ